ncbi:MAG: hypothetical protein IJ189_11115 [Clostridia bacterium]|nr:hypothetical protein [Clostridia bacterium]
MIITHEKEEMIMPNQQGCTLTSKDLAVLEDQLTHVAMGCRIAEQYANQFQNAQLKNMAATVAQHHRQHYDALFAFLNGCQ